jgi:hypothetical protein
VTKEIPVSGPKPVRKRRKANHLLKEAKHLLNEADKIVEEAKRYEPGMLSDKEAQGLRLKVVSIEQEASAILEIVRVTQEAKGLKPEPGVRDAVRAAGAFARAANKSAGNATAAIDEGVGG